MKILNLYAGVGGNRRNWSDVSPDLEVTAVETDKEIADIYRALYPKDRMLETDAHAYLEAHYHEYDFVWTSPPCPTHSQIRYFTTVSGRNRNGAKPRYPDMRLYEEILFLKYHAPKAGVRWLVENVSPYYPPLIAPSNTLGKHYVWTSDPVSHWEQPSKRGIRWDQMDGGRLIEWLAYPELQAHMTGRVYQDRQRLRNCVHPSAGRHALEDIMSRKQQVLIGGRGK